MDCEAEDPPTSIIPASESIFSQVVFTNVKKFYPPKTDVQCDFRTEESLDFNPKDWIGIFKVGWKTTSEYFTWISARTKVDNSVLFKAYYLPKDDDYYQFCYVDQNGEVRGASIPFQFCYNIPEDDDDDDILMVTTEMEMMKKNEENAELKEALEKLKEENSSLKEKLSSLQNENQAQAGRIQNLQDDPTRSTETIQRLETENMELSVQVKNLVDENERMKETIQSLNIDLQMQRNQEEKLLSEIKEMERLKDDIQTEIKHLEELQIHIKTLEEENAKVKSELNLYWEKEEKFLSEKEELEKVLEKSMAERHHFQNEAVAKQKVVETMTCTVNQCKEETVKLKAEHELQAYTLEKEKKQRENVRQLLDKELRKVLDLERNLELKTEKLRSAEEMQDSLHRQIESLKAENENKLKQMGALHITIANLEGEVKRMKGEFKMEAERTRQNETGLRTKLRSAEEAMNSLELQLAQQQDVSREQGEEILTLRSALELREEEIQDFKDIHRNDRITLDELHSRLLGRGPTSSTSPDQSLIFGNPYEGNVPRFSRGQGPLSGAASGRPPSPLRCPECDQTFSPHQRQIYEDHVMCHEAENEARP
ncbi:calcium-binding and coiled-coil domain-containing protein 2 [Dendropsophus ebraccatus]|uniref:calcium-binding and coiled-coil domain-containing protein 2 n=1 Tax=Dendropsophus ebraccatus TaxID=150705 RepID=UPI00383160FC